MEREFLLPPRVLNERGELRKVGFEIEFGGIGLDEAKAVVTGLFGGRLQRENNYRYIAHTGLGDFAIESDADFLQKNQAAQVLHSLGLDPGRSNLGKNIKGAVNTLAEKIAPFEIATPPLPLGRFAAVERLRAELQRRSATGTNASLISAFGMQINPELPDLRVETILSVLRAFFLLYDWLFEEGEIPIARRLAPYIHDFPKEYVELVLGPDYRPDLARFMTDYLEFNPTRNRPLDLLPLLTFIDRDIVFRYPVEKEMIKARPTFHYRLPNSQVDDPEWTIASVWNRWVEIERLAEDEERLKNMARDYFRTREETLVFSRAKWIEKTRAWLYARP
jgi:hypothetical protein